MQFVTSMHPPSYCKPAPENSIYNSKYMNVLSSVQYYTGVLQWMRKVGEDC